MINWLIGTYYRFCDIIFSYTAFQIDRHRFKRETTSLLVLAVIMFLVTGLFA